MDAEADAQCSTARSGVIPNTAHAILEHGSSSSATPEQERSGPCDDVAVTRLPLTGGCNCGAVRYEVSAPLVAASYCHCRRCQRRSGAAASPNAHPAPGTFRVVKGEDRLRVWKPDDGGEKWFCGDCGSSIFGHNPSHADPIGIRMGTFDEDPGIRPMSVSSSGMQPHGSRFPTMDCRGVLPVDIPSDRPAGHTRPLRSRCWPATGMSAILSVPMGCLFLPTVGLCGAFVAGPRRCKPSRYPLTISRTAKGVPRDDGVPSTTTAVHRGDRPAEGAYAEAAWNTRGPARVAAAYTVDTVWRNRDEFISGRAEIEAFLECDRQPSRVGHSGACHPPEGKFRKTTCSFYGRTSDAELRRHARLRAVQLCDELNALLAGELPVADDLDSEPEAVEPHAACSSPKWLGSWVRSSVGRVRREEPSPRVLPAVVDQT